MKTSCALMCGFFLCLSGCGGNALNEGEDYGNLLNTPNTTFLTQSEHTLGWEQADCTICHNLNNIHLVNRTGTAINIQQIHDNAITDGLAGCAVCHGQNR